MYPDGQEKKLFYRIIFRVAGSDIARPKKHT